MWQTLILLLLAVLTACSEMKEVFHEDPSSRKQILSDTDIDAGEGVVLAPSSSSNASSSSVVRMISPKSGAILGQTVKLEARVDSLDVQGVEFYGMGNLGNMQGCTSNYNGQNFEFCE